MLAPAVVYDSLAGLLDYPRGDFRARVEGCRLAAGEVEPTAAELLAAFQTRTEKLAAEDFEELFVRTFEHNPPCALEVGWHLFGENYERGAFLVWMRAQLRRFGLAESGELPDHITHVLGVLGRLEPAEADDFARDCVLPALERLRTGLDGKGNPYESIVAAVCRVLTVRHGPARPRPAPLPVLQPDEFREMTPAGEVCP